MATAVQAALTILRPPPDLSISDWADANRRLSSEASAEPGQWRTSRAEYQRGIMDAISDGSVESVVIMSSAQVGKALAIDTPIATPAGWSTMGTLRPGDIVFDETGAPCRVSALSALAVHGASSWGSHCSSSRKCVEALRQLEHGVQVVPALGEGRCF